MTDSTLNRLIVTTSLLIVAWTVFLIVYHADMALDRKSHALSHTTNQNALAPLPRSQAAGFTVTPQPTTNTKKSHETY